MIFSMLLADFFVMITKAVLTKTLLLQQVWQDLAHHITLLVYQIVSPAFDKPWNRIFREMWGIPSYHQICYRITGTALPAQHSTFAAEDILCGSHLELPC